MQFKDGKKKKKSFFNFRRRKEKTETLSWSRLKLFKRATTPVPEQSLPRPLINVRQVRTMVDPKRLFLPAAVAPQLSDVEEEVRCLHKVKKKRRTPLSVIKSLLLNRETKPSSLHADSDAGCLNGGGEVHTCHISSAKCKSSPQRLKQSFNPISIAKLKNNSLFKEKT